MSDPAPPERRVRLAYLVSHPIQYQAPLLRRIARERDIDLTVFFGSDFSLRHYTDEGFGIDIRWDIPLVEGYRHEFLPALYDNASTGVFTPFNFGIFSRLRGRSGESPFDLLWIHGYGSINALNGMIVAKALGIPVVLRADSSLSDRPRGGIKLFAKKLFFDTLKPLISGVLTAGIRNEAYWRHYLGDDMPMFRLPYAVDNAWFRERTLVAAASRSVLQAELHLDPGRPVLLFASKLQKRKRCIDLIEAYLVLVSAPGPRPYLLIVGDGDQRAALEARAGGVEGVRFCGFRNQSELPRFFDLATVFVLPSHHEPWGLVVNEAMNAALPIILSDEVGCHPDLLTDGVEGFLYPAGDVAALAGALAKILGLPETASRMGRAALARIEAFGFEQDMEGLRNALAALTRKITS